VCRVQPFSTLLLLHAKSTSQFPHVNGCTIHATEFRFKQSQKLSWNIMDIGYSCWARKTRTSCHNWNTFSKTFLLDNQHASVWNIISLCLLSYLCTLLKTFNAFSNARGWIYQLFDILKNLTSGYILKLTSNH